MLQSPLKREISWETTDHCCREGRSFKPLFLNRLSKGTLIERRGNKCYPYFISILVPTSEPAAYARETEIHLDYSAATPVRSGF